MRHRLLRSFSFVITIIIIMQGCWNSKELNEIEIVSAVGLEKKDENVVLISQVIIPKNSSGQTNVNTSDSSSYENYIVGGETVFDAVRNTTLTAKNKLFHQHNKALVFSNETAKEGVLEYIDFFLRDHDIRPQLNILITEDNLLKTLEAKTKLADIPGLYIAELLENSKSNSKTGVINIKDFFSRINNDGIEPYATTCRLTEDDKKLELCGTSIFKKDRLVGKFNFTESRGLLWVLGEVKSGIIVVDCPIKKGEISFETIRSDSDIIVEKMNNEIFVTVKISELGNIGGQSCPINDLNTKIKNELVNKKSQAIKNEVLSAVKKAQELNSDVFGFGQAVYKKYPKYWKIIKNQWDSIFPDLKVKVIVNSKIKRSGSIIKWK